MNLWEMEWETGKRGLILTITLINSKKCKKKMCFFFFAGGFYLCRLCQNVYEKTSKIKVYWMNELANRPGVYEWEYVEWLHGNFTTIITDVKVKKVRVIDL